MTIVKSWPYELKIIISIVLFVLPIISLLISKRTEYPVTIPSNRKIMSLGFTPMGLLLFLALVTESPVFKIGGGVYSLIYILGFSITEFIFAYVNHDTPQEAKKVRIVIIVGWSIIIPSAIAIALGKVFGVI